MISAIKCGRLHFADERREVISSAILEHFESYRAASLGFEPPPRYCRLSRSCRLVASPDYRRSQPESASS